MEVIIRPTREAAAAHLTQRKYYRWIFEYEPEWKPFRQPRIPLSGIGGSMG